jgi:C4-dicarboxylate-specific signal transduction histidine kinase
LVSSLVRSRHQAEADLARVNRVMTMGTLTAALAHDVNQPIAAAVTNASASLRWLAKDPPNLEEARAALRQIVSEGTRAAEIVSRARLMFTKAVPRREPIDVNAVIRETVALLQARQRGTTFVCEWSSRTISRRSAEIGCSCSRYQAAWRRNGTRSLPVHRSIPRRTLVGR